MKDLQRAPEFDQSALFKKVYEEEFGVFGGAPFGALIGDYHFGKGPEDIELIERISQVAASAHAPFLTGADPQFFNLDSYTQSGCSSRSRQGVRHDRIREVEVVPRERRFPLRWPGSASRAGAVCRMARTLCRWKASPMKRTSTERITASTCWMNAAWALGARLTQAFSLYGWCASIRGVEGGGLVQGLPVHNFYTDEGDIAMKCPTEVPITDRREKELADLGFIPLVHCKGTDYAAFFSVQSAQKPKVYDKDAANANARLSAQLPYILACSRFAHYLKAMMRDKVGSFMSRSDCEALVEPVDHQLRFAGR